MNDDDFSTLLLARPKTHVLLVTLNRPEVANAFNTDMAREMVKLFDETTAALPEVSSW